MTNITTPRTKPPGSRGRVEPGRHHQCPRSRIQEPPKWEALRGRDKGKQRREAKGCPPKRQDTQEKRKEQGVVEIRGEGRDEGGQGKKSLKREPLHEWHCPARA